MLIVCYKTCFLDWLIVNLTYGWLFVVIFAGENNFRKRLEKHLKKSYENNWNICIGAGNDDCHRHGKTEVGYLSPLC